MFVQFIKTRMAEKNFRNQVFMHFLESKQLYSYWNGLWDLLRSVQILPVNQHS